MNTDRSSDGPYTDGGGRGAHVIGPGLEDKQQRTFIDVDLASLLNLAHAEGRKSAEKDFRELLEMANKMTHELPCVTTSELELIAWKKARGIE